MTNVIVHIAPMKLSPILALSFVLLFTSLLSVTLVLGSLRHEDYNFKHSYLDKFDIIQANDIKETVLVTRDTVQDDSRSPVPRKFSFSALGRTFRLILNQAPNLISPFFEISTIDERGRRTPFTYKHVENQVLQGHLEGDPNSLASATLMAHTVENSRHQHDADNEIRAGKGTIMATHIRTGNDFFIIEPSYLHQDNLKTSSSELSLNNTMIVYNLNDHKSINNSTFEPQAYCDQINMNEYILPGSNRTISTNRLSMEKLDDSFRTKRSPTYVLADTQKKTRCTILIAVDFLFFKNVGRQSVTTTVNYVLGLMSRVNMIYMNTTWSTGSDGEAVSKIGFTVQKIDIHKAYHIVSRGEKHYNMETNNTWEAREYLENFSKHVESKWFCLAHLLTYRKFNSTVLGLAFVASARPGTIGGICSERYEKDGFTSSFNTGISTSLSVSGETLITRQTDLVVAHELGHNFGAEHDIQDQKCSPKASDGGAFLMHAYSVPGFAKNNRLFSPCSRNSIWQVLRRKSHLCFSDIQEEVCGNGIVDKGEECDGGNFGDEIEDQCCDESCRLKPGTACSDRHSLCCSNCQITLAAQICRSGEQYHCKQASYCDGTSADCPAAAPADDGTKCTGTGECRNGECMPFCETKGMISCLCETPKDACRLCCKSQFDISQQCKPFEGSKLPILADGTLCYRGVCEKGRCEQMVQDVVERLWDVIEDINFSTVSRILRDNIVLVTLFVSIPIWLIGLYLVEKFDKMLMAQLANEIMSNTGGKKSRNLDNEQTLQASHPSAFLPTYFGDASKPPSPPSPGFKTSTVEDENGFCLPKSNIDTPNYNVNGREDSPNVGSIALQVRPTLMISDPNQSYIDDETIEEIEDNIRNGRRIAFSTQV